MIADYARRAAERALGRLEQSGLQRFAGEINEVRRHLGLKPITLELKEEGAPARPTEGATSSTTAPLVDLDGLVEQVAQRLKLSQPAASTAGAEAPQLNMDYLVHQVTERLQQAQPVAAAPPLPPTINMDELAREVAGRLPKTDTRDTRALIKKALEDLDLADLADRVYEDLDLDRVAEKLAPLLVERLMGDPKTRSDLIQALAEAYW